jgi:hypothetical protein
VILAKMMIFKTSRACENCTKTEGKGTNCKFSINMGRLRWPTYSCKVASMLALTVYPIRQPRQRRQIFKCKQLVLGCIQMSFEETLGIIARKWALLQMSKEV